MSTSNAAVKIVADLRGFVEDMTRTMIETTFAEFPPEIREVLVRNIVDLAIVRDAVNEESNYPDDAMRLAVIRQVLADNEAWYDEADDTEGESDDGLSS
jgi:hypothetical protein